MSRSTSNPNLTEMPAGIIKKFLKAITENQTETIMALLVEYPRLHHLQSSFFNPDLVVVADSVIAELVDAIKEKKVQTAHSLLMKYPQLVRAPLNKQEENALAIAIKYKSYEIAFGLLIPNGARIAEIEDSNHFIQFFLSQDNEYPEREKAELIEKVKQTLEKRDKVRELIQHLKHRIATLIEKYATDPSVNHCYLQLLYIAKHQLVRSNEYETIDPARTLDLFLSVNTIVNLMVSSSSVEIFNKSLRGFIALKEDVLIEDCSDYSNNLSLANEFCAKIVELCFVGESVMSLLLKNALTKQRLWMHPYTMKHILPANPGDFFRTQDNKLHLYTAITNAAFENLEAGSTTYANIWRVVDFERGEANHLALSDIALLRQRSKTLDQLGEYVELLERRAKEDKNIHLQLTSLRDHLRKGNFLGTGEELNAGAEASEGASELINWWKDLGETPDGLELQAKIKAIDNGELGIILDVIFNTNPKAINANPFHCIYLRGADLAAILQKPNVIAELKVIDKTIDWLTTNEKLSEWKASIKRELVASAPVISTSHHIFKTLTEKIEAFDTYQNLDELDYFSVFKYTTLEFLWPRGTTLSILEKAAQQKNNENFINYLIRFHLHSFSDAHLTNVIELLFENRYYSAVSEILKKRPHVPHPKVKSTQIINALKKSTVRNQDEYHTHLISHLNDPSNHLLHVVVAEFLPKWALLEALTQCSRETLNYRNQAGASAFEVAIEFKNDAVTRNFIERRLVIESSCLLNGFTKLLQRQDPKPDSSQEQPNPLPLNLLLCQLILINYPHSFTDAETDALLVQYSQNDIIYLEIVEELLKGRQSTQVVEFLGRDEKQDQFLLDNYVMKLSDDLLVLSFNHILTKSKSTALRVLEEKPQLLKNICVTDIFRSEYDEKLYTYVLDHLDSTISSADLLSIIKIFVDKAKDFNHIQDLNGEQTRNLIEPLTKILAIKPRVLYGQPSEIKKIILALLGISILPGVGVTRVMAYDHIHVEVSKLLMTKEMLLDLSNDSLFHGILSKSTTIFETSPEVKNSLIKHCIALYNQNPNANLELLVINLLVTCQSDHLPELLSQYPNYVPSSEFLEKIFSHKLSLHLIYSILDGVQKYFNHCLKDKEGVKKAILNMKAILRWHPMFVDTITNKYTPNLFSKQEIEKLEVQIVQLESPVPSVSRLSIPRLNQSSQQRMTPTISPATEEEISAEISAAARQLFTEYDIPLGYYKKLTALATRTFCFVIDDSIHMMQASDEHPDKSRWEEAKERLCFWIKCLIMLPVEKVKVYFLNSRINYCFELHCYFNDNMECYPKLRDQNGDWETVIDQHFSLTPTGPTNYTRLGSIWLSNVDKPLYYVLTDGVPNCLSMHDYQLICLSDQETRQTPFTTFHSYPFEKSQFVFFQGPEFTYTRGMWLLDQLLVQTNRDLLDLRHRTLDRNKIYSILTGEASPQAITMSFFSSFWPGFSPSIGHRVNTMTPKQ